MIDTAVAFDFNARIYRDLTLDEVADACAAGLFCWVDVDARDDAALGRLERLLRGLGTADAVVADLRHAVGRPGQRVHEECLHATLEAPCLVDGQVHVEVVEMFIGASFLVTARRGQADFLDQVRRTCRVDFERYAQSPGFLLYEIWDHLVMQYRATQRSLSTRVRTIQAEIFGEVDDRIFSRVANVGRDLLTFRELVLAAREDLGELCNRRHEVVPTSTVPFLEKMLGTLERICADVTVERETLSETLNLYLGIVSKKTNDVVTRLTAVSVIFLPLTFLCGVYGMNFQYIPEIHNDYGYFVFWFVCAVLVSTMIYYMRKHSWL